MPDLRPPVLRFAWCLGLELLDPLQDLLLGSDVLPQPLAERRSSSARCQPTGHLAASAQAVGQLADLGNRQTEPRAVRR